MKIIKHPWIILTKYINIAAMGKDRMQRIGQVPDLSKLSAKQKAGLYLQHPSGKPQPQRIAAIEEEMLQDPQRFVQEAGEVGRTAYHQIDAEDF